MQEVRCVSIANMHMHKLNLSNMTYRVKEILINWIVAQTIQCLQEHKLLCLE